MKLIVHFLRTTIVGGVLFLVPIVVLALILGKVLEVGRKVLAPVAAYLPAGMDVGAPKATFLAIVATVLICFVSGLFARSILARHIVEGLEESVLTKIPAYQYLKDVTGSILGADNTGEHRIVLVRTGGAWRVAVQAAILSNDHIAVFLPNAPNANSGAVMFVSRDQVRQTDIPLSRALYCMKRYGAGADALLGDLSLDHHSA
jgi:uncharacterized membrane protein